MSVMYKRRLVWSIATKQGNVQIMSQGGRRRVAMSTGLHARKCDETVGQYPASHLVVALPIELRRFPDVSERR